MKKKTQKKISKRLIIVNLTCCFDPSGFLVLKNVDLAMKQSIYQFSSQCYTLFRSRNFMKILFGSGNNINSAL